MVTTLYLCDKAQQSLLLHLSCSIYLVVLYDVEGSFLQVNATSCAVLHGPVQVDFGALS